MPETAKTVTRQELYQQVWSTSITKLAQQYGVSDVAIAKACKRLNVPRPPRGYWVKLEFGKRVTKPKLPAIKVGEPTSTTIDPARSIAQPKTTSDLSQDLPAVEVRENLRQCHPLVSATRQCIESAKPGEDHIVRHGQHGVLGVFVSKSSLLRALRITDALISACEQRGWKVAAPKDAAATVVVVGDDSLSLSLSEKVDRAEIPRKPQQYWSTYSYTATGRLALQITDYIGDGLRAKWADGKRQRLEDLLPTVMVGIESAAEHLRVRRIARIERERKWEEERRQREDLARRVKVERARRTHLTDEVARWHQAEAISRLCAALEERSNLNPMEFEPVALATWLKWARSIAKNLDPFQNGYFREAVKHVGLDATLDCSKDIPVW